MHLKLFWETTTIGQKAYLRLSLQTLKEVPHFCDISSIHSNKKAMGYEEADYQAKSELDWAHWIQKLHLKTLR